VGGTGWAATRLLANFKFFHILKLLIEHPRSFLNPRITRINRIEHPRSF